MYFVLVEYHILCLRTGSQFSGFSAKQGIKQMLKELGLMRLQQTTTVVNSLACSYRLQIVGVICRKLSIAVRRSFAANIFKFCKKMIQIVRSKACYKDVSNINTLGISSSFIRTIEIH